MKFKILDLFCGAGSFSHGLEKNKNFKTVVALDNNNFALETFKHNFKYVSVICGDICNEGIKNKVITESKIKNVNMIIGGPPCQGFSLKGKKLGLKDPRNFLFLEFFYFVEKLKPEVVIIENVKNMIYSAKGFL